MDTQQETIRQIAKREYDAVNSNGIYSSTGTLGWSIWKRAYDSAAANLPSIHQQQLAEYRLWLAQTINQLNYDSSSSYDDMYIKGFEKALNKFKEMFPIVQIADTQTLSDHLDKIPGMEIMDNRWPLGGIPDETDNIYPKH